MTVPKGRRKESRFEVQYQATVLHEALTRLVLRSFGVYSLNSPIRHVYDPLIYRDENKEYPASMLLKFKDDLIEAASNIERYIRLAKAIYPHNSAEYAVRCDYQARALGECSSAMIILEEVARYYDVDLEYYAEPVKMINKEINLIKKWQKADRKRFGSKFC